jgi:signal transduction histidine kinase
MDLELAFHIAERMQAAGAWVYVLFLLMHAIRAPAELNEKSGKAAFFVMLVMGLAAAVKNTAVYVGGGALSSLMSQQNLAVELMLRGLGPLVISLLIYFLLVSNSSQRWNHLQSTLHHAQGSLDLEKQRLERQLKFNVMLSHELKNPLMASQMALSNLQRQLAPVGLPLQSVDTIEHSLQTIDVIIERCAEIDAYESASVPLTLSRFSVADLLAAVKAAHKNERIYIVTRRLDETLLLTSDMDYLKVILSNLLTNALKYSKPDTLVEFLLVLGHEAPAQLEFCVSNTMGVAGAPDPAQVFDRYYRSEGARQQPGTGQGLWLAQSMAQALGSRIRLKVDGQVVTFGFSLRTK